MDSLKGGTNAPASSVGAFGIPVGSSDGEVVQRELTRSTRLRARTMSWVMGIASLNVLAVVFLLPRLGIELLPPELPVQAVVLLVLFLWLPELVLLGLFRHGGPRWGSHPVVEGLVGILQISAVSVFLAVSARVLDPPLLAIIGPGPWLYFPLIAISVLTLRPIVVLITGAVAAAELVVLITLLVPSVEGVFDGGMASALSSPSFHYQKVLILILTTIVGAAVAFDLRRRMRRIATGVREREQLVSIFGQHVAPEVVEALIASGGKVKPERREVAILFLDIRGFTQASEQIAPEAVVARLGHFFELVLPKVTEHGGIVHQLLGDGFMAIFGAPVAHTDDAWRAITAALEIHDLVEAANADGRIETTDIVIGVHYGEVVVGPVGAANHKEYKATGDAVNVAARLESLAKDLDAAVLSSRAAVQAAGLEDQVIKDLGDVPIRGRNQPLRVLQLR